MTTESTADTEPIQLPTAPSLVRQAALNEIAALAELTAGLSTDDWQKPSAVSGWTIGHVVTHLDLAIGLYNRVLSAVVAGRGSGPAWKAFGELTKKAATVASPAFNAVNRAIPRMLSGALSPETLRGQLAGRARILREKLEKVGSADYTRPIHYMGRPWPLSMFLAAIVNELAVHGWDIRSQLQSDAHLSEDARLVLPSFYWSATPFMFRRPEGFKGTVQVKLADPDFTAWWAASQSGVTQGLGEVKPDATITGEAGTFVLILAGRISPDDAIRTTSISVDGEETLAKGFLASWKIF